MTSITETGHAKNAINAVNAVLPAYSNAVAAREAAFEPLNKFITRVNNAQSNRHHRTSG